MNNLQKNEFEFLKKNYDIDHIERVQKVNKGFLSNNVFIYTKKDKFFLKQNRSEVVYMLHEIEKAEDFFAQGGFPVLLPIPTKKGKKHVEYNKNYYTLYPFIKEKIIEVGHLTKEHLYNLGKFLAQMHQYSIDHQIEYQDTPGYKDDWDKNKTISKLNEILDIVKEKSDKNSEIYKKSIDFKKKYIKSNTTTFDKLKIEDFFLVHGDFHSNNIFFNKRKEIVSVFDFEKTKVASIAVEFARAAFLVCFNHSYSANNFRRFAYFWNGYNCERQMTKSFLKKGFIVVVNKLFHSYWFEQEKFIKSNNRLDELYKENYKSLKYFSAHEKDFYKKICS